jgi:hypothetical protein
MKHDIEDAVIKGESITMVEQPLPKVAICVPSGDMVHAAFCASLTNLAYTCGPHRGMQAVPLAQVYVQGSLIVRNRNKCIEEAQKAGVDYVLFLDSDMTFPPVTLRRLLSHEKDIVGCTYVMREPPHQLLGVVPQDAQLTSDRIHEVIALPAGVLLIKLSVFEGMEKPYFRTPVSALTGDIQGEDYYFCEQAVKLGHKIWLDVALSTQIGHIGRTTHTIEVQQAPQAANQEAVHGQAAIH